MDPRPACARCGEPVPARRRGPAAQYCSAACRQSAYRDRRQDDTQRLHAEIARLRAELAAAQAEVERLRAEAVTLQAEAPLRRRSDGAGMSWCVVQSELDGSLEVVLSVHGSERAAHVALTRHRSNYYESYGYDAMQSCSWRVEQRLVASPQDRPAPERAQVKVSW